MYGWTLCVARGVCGWSCACGRKLGARNKKTKSEGWESLMEDLLILPTSNSERRRLLSVESMTDEQLSSEIERLLVRHESADRVTASVLAPWIATMEEELLNRT